MPKLLDHDKLLIGSNSNDIDPVHTIQDIEFVRLVGTRRNLLVSAHGEDAKVAERLCAGRGPGLDHKGRVAKKEPVYQPRSRAAHPCFIKVSRWARASSYEVPFASESWRARLSSCRAISMDLSFGQPNATRASANRN